MKREFTVSTAEVCEVANWCYVQEVAKVRTAWDTWGFTKFHAQITDSSVLSGQNENALECEVKEINSPITRSVARVIFFLISVSSSRPHPKNRKRFGQGLRMRLHKVWPWIIYLLVWGYRCALMNERSCTVNPTRPVGSDSILQLLTCRKCKQ